ncbi:hypothetical protein HBI46_195220 [Parastagonospora nodorum]|nr:hypothetical protein HBI46_195220 [Parastagonospora nodorum]
MLSKRLQRVFGGYKELIQYEHVLQTVSKYVSHDKATADIQKQREAFVQKHQELEKSKKNLEDEEYNFRVQTTMLAIELTAHSKSACLELATEFYAIMPREVRDLVYSYLYRSVDSPQDKRSKDKMEPGPDHLRRSIPHWQSKEYVGHEFAREYTEFFYEHTQLQFKAHWCCMEALDDLLLRDPFGYGFTPVDLIRAIYITFRGPRRKVTENVFESFRDQSKVLLKLKQSTQVTFRIQLETMFVDETVELDFLLKVLKLLAPMLYNFKKHGRSFDVFIVFDSHVSTKLARNIKFLWDMTQGNLIAKIKSWSTSYANLPEDSFVFGCKLKDVPLKKKSDYFLLKWMLNEPEEEEMGQDYSRISYGGKTCFLS